MGKTPPGNNVITPSDAKPRKEKTARTLTERLDSAKIMLKNLASDVYAEHGAEVASRIQGGYKELTLAELPK